MHYNASLLSGIAYLHCILMRFLLNYVSNFHNPSDAFITVQPHQATHAPKAGRAVQQFQE